MAFIMSAEAQSTFFTKFFGDYHDVTAKVKTLVGKGVKFTTGLYTVEATWNGNFSSVNLTKGVTPLMKGAVDPAIVEHNKTLLTEWVNGLYAEAGSPLSLPMLPIPTKPVSAPTKVVMTGVEAGFNLLLLIKRVAEVKPAPTLTETKLAVEAVKAGTKELDFGVFPSLEAANAVAQKIKMAGGIVELIAFPVTTYTTPILHPEVTVNVTAKPVDAVIALKDAQALGQKVHGTSSGSVYYTVAIGEHVRVAARLYKSGSVSIRAEWVDGAVAKPELAKLQASGVAIKAVHGYGSIHFEAAGVPLERIVGAFLLGTGIQWKSVVTSGAELVITGGQ